MPICNKCTNSFKNWAYVDGKRRNLSNRKYCLVCSPFGQHNRKKIHLPASDRLRYDVYHRSQSKMRAERKRKIVELKGYNCEICKYNRCLSAFDFHHIDPTTKSFELTKSNLSNHSWESILRELSKTVLLCRNCHSEVHQGMHRELEKKWLASMVPMV